MHACSVIIFTALPRSLAALGSAASEQACILLPDGGMRHHPSHRVPKRTRLVVCCAAAQSALLCALCCSGCASHRLSQPVGRSLHPTVAPSRSVPTKQAAAASTTPATGAISQSPRGFTACSLPDEPATALLFSSDSAALRPRSVRLLDHLANCLLRGDLIGATVEVRAYSDNRGSNEYNMELATRRAETVQTFLTRRGVPSEQIDLAPLGERRAGGTGPESWQYDRRVEVSLAAAPKGQSVRRVDQLAARRTATPEETPVCNCCPREANSL